MELSSNQAEALNMMLPHGFLIEQVALSEQRPKRTETEKLKTDLRFPAISAPPSTQVSRPDRDAPPQKTQRTESFLKVHSILKRLKSHASIGPFLQPVDRNKIADYYDIIHCPVDLSLVEKRLMSEYYPSSKEFAADIRKMWSNSFLYNSRGTDIYIATIDLSAYFENLIKGNEDIPLRALPSTQEAVILPKVIVNGPYNDAKRRQLGSRIKMLQPKYYKGIYDIVKNATGAGAKGDEFQFDIEMLPDDVCHRLDEYTSQCLSETRSTAQLPSAAQPSEPALSSSSESDESSDVDDSEDFNDAEALSEETQGAAIKTEDQA